MPLIRRRRPLLRAAAVGGGAYMAGRRRAEADAAAAPAPEPAGGSDTVSQLKALAELRDQGVLTDEEFAQQKAKLLDRS